ncbi:MAG: hypothetical protein ABFS41_09880 [Myxococcota bacterium]
MATIKQATTFKHQSNLGEGVEDVAFAGGEEVTVLKEFESHYLVKNAQGQLFNVPKESVTK